MIELFTWPTPNGTKPSIMLEEVGAPYSVHLVNLSTGEQHAPQFLAVSPNGKIPAIVDHDGVGGPRIVFESGAILVYLAEKNGMLLPASGGRREQAMSWLFWAMSGVGPASSWLCPTSCFMLRWRMRFCVIWDPPLVNATILVR